MSIKKLNRPQNPSFPYSLHDARIRKIQVKKHHISFCFSKIFRYENDTETTHRARISFLDTDSDFCNIQISEHPDKKGKYKGREYSLKKFAMKYPHADLEIISECYNGYDTIWEGFFYHKKKDYRFRIYLWHQGSICYEIAD